MDEQKIVDQNCLKKKTEFTLYKKEQLVLSITLLCFVLSGIALPMVKNHLLLPNSEIETSSDISSEKSKEKTDKKKKTDSSDESPTDSTTPTVPENPEATTDNSDNTNNSQTSSDKKEDSATSENPQKEWVPPVYQTIHHPAVTETHQFYYCSGAIDESGVICNIKFNSLEEWAAHKKTNGG